MSVSRIAILAALAAPATAAAQSEDPMSLGAVVVEAESDETLLQNGYVATSGRQATKLDTEITAIPQAVGVVTQDEIEDRQPRQLLEALEYSSGTSTSNFGFDSRYDSFYLRGFSSFNNGFFRDSLRQVNGPSAWYRNVPYTFEGVSLLKGPSSSLYGVSGPGGLVNIVSKRPKEDPFNELRLTTGSNEHAEMNFDFTGPAGKDGRLFYRLTGMARDSETQVPGYRDDLALLAPSFTYQLTDRTRFTFLSEYAEATLGATAYYFNPPGENRATDTFAGDPDYNRLDQDQYRVGYELSHELTDSITLRQNLRYSEVETDLRYSGVFGASTDQLTRYWQHYRETQESFSINNTAEFRFDLEGFEHEMIVGVDYTDASYDTLATPLAYVSGAATDDLPLEDQGDQETSQTGVYVHDQLSRGPLTIFASGRYDWVDVTTGDGTGGEEETGDEEFSGRLGVSYAISEDLTLYGNVSSAFVPNTGVVYDDLLDPSSASSAEPATANQREIGVKYRLPVTDSLITASVFDIAQENGTVFQVLTDAQADALELNQVQVPYDLRSHGFEVEGEFNFSRGLSLVASYTYLDMEIESGRAATEGNQLSATPHNQASLWMMYEPRDGSLGGFGLGGGLRYVGESWGDDENTFRNDSFVFADAAATYDFGRIGFEGLELQVNVRNVFDEKGQTCSAGACYFHEGRSGTTAIQYRF